MRYLLLFFLTILIATSCASGDFGMNSSGKIADSITIETASQITSTYEYFRLAGAGGAKGFRKMTMSLDVHKKINKVEARALIIEFAEMYLNQINRNEKVKELADDYPLNVNNIEISLFIVPPEGEIFHPDVATVSLDDGMVLFWTFEESGKSYKSLEEETYGEARAITKGGK
jgi:hypothetical protein